MVRGIIDSIPLWSVLVVTIVVVFGSFESGFRLGARHRVSRGDIDEAPINAVTGAHLGLLAFFLAFSFNMAASHYDKRKQVVLAEVNAIETAYARAWLMSDAAVGDELQALLRDYVAVRSSLSPGADIDRIIRGSERLQSEMWQQVVLLTRSGRATGADNLMARSINTVMEVHKQRIAAGLHNRNPPSIWAVLYAVLVFSMVGMGYSFGIKGSRNYIGSFALALSFAIVLYLIADLDRPTGGLVIADQSAMQALQEKLRQFGNSWGQ